MENVLQKSQTPLYSLHVELIYIQSETIFKCYLSCTATESQPVLESRTALTILQASGLESAFLIECLVFTLGPVLI